MAEIHEEEKNLSYIETLHITESMYYNIGKPTEFKQQIMPIKKKLEELQYIGNDPLKYWENNRVVCKLDIINPDLIIQDKPIIPPPQMSEEYKQHIDELVSIKVIRPSKRRHRIAAFIVNKHSE